MLDQDGTASLDPTGTGPYPLWTISFTINATSMDAIEDRDDLLERQGWSAIITGIFNYCTMDVSSELREVDNQDRFNHPFVLVRTPEDEENLKVVFWRNSQGLCLV